MQRQIYKYLRRSNWEITEPQIRSTESDAHLTEYIDTLSLAIEEMGDKVEPIIDSDETPDKLYYRDTVKHKLRKIFATSDDTVDPPGEYHGGDDEYSSSDDEIGVNYPACDSDDDCSDSDDEPLNLLGEVTGGVETEDDFYSTLVQNSGDDFFNDIEYVEGEPVEDNIFEGGDEPVEDNIFEGGAEFNIFENVE